jgi:ribA/ribD-fused uncharacterized protein
MEKFTFFWSNKSPFSNWYRIDFEIENIRFNCSEQYMMYKKAMLFNDDEVAKKITATNNPGKQKALGRQVKNFNQELWEKNCKQIVYEANYAKFTQNEHLLKALLKTKGTTLVEASPVDFIWGIGLEEDDPRALDRKQWRGTNWLGELLTELRENLIKEENG